MNRHHERPCQAGWPLCTYGRPARDDSKMPVQMEICVKNSPVLALKDIDSEWTSQ